MGRTKDLATQARSVAADDFKDLDGSTNGSRKIAPFDEHGQFGNALAFAGGLRFAGFTYNNAFAALTGWAIGTGEFSVSMKLRLPLAPQNTMGIFGFSTAVDSSAAIATTVFAFFGSDNVLRVRIYGAAVTDYNEVSTSVAGFLGKSIVLVLTRSGTTVALYINGVAQTLGTASGGTSPTWAGSITSTYFILGCRYGNATESFFGDIHVTAPYNLALTAADALEIFEIGGGVADRFRWPNLAEIAVNGGFAADTDWTKEAGWTIGSGVATATAAADNKGVYQTPGASLQRGGVYRVTFTVSGYSAGGVKPHIDIGSATVAGTVRSADGTYTEILRVPERSGSSAMYLGFYTSGVTTLSIDNVSCVQVGAVACWPMDDGFGLQLADISTNRLHALVCAISNTLGIMHLLQRETVRLRGSTNTNGNQRLLGQLSIPAGAKISAIRVKSMTGTPTIVVGVTSAGAQLVASVAIGTADRWQELTVLQTETSTGLGLGVLTYQEISVWVNSNSTDVLDFDIELKRISP